MLNSFCIKIHNIDCMIYFWFHNFMSVNTLFKSFFVRIKCGDVTFLSHFSLLVFTHTKLVTAAFCIPHIGEDTAAH